MSKDRAICIAAANWLEGQTEELQDILFDEIRKAGYMTFCKSAKIDPDYAAHGDVMVTLEFFDGSIREYIVDDRLELFLLQEDDHEA